MRSDTTTQADEATAVATTPNTYRVKAIWRTLQGEGCFAGRPAVFVRMVGCNMWSGREQDRERFAEHRGAHCPMWCDTDFTKENSRTGTAEVIARTVRHAAGDDIRFCVLTGGEPLLQVDAELVHALHEAGFQVAMETNGTMSLRERCWDDERDELVAPDWIVCSPKLPQDQLELEFFDELKLVVPDYRPNHYAQFAERARRHDVGGHHLPLLWLQPEEGPRFDEAKRLAVELALEHPAWRVSVQTQNVLDIR